MTTKQAIELIMKVKTASELFGDDEDAVFKRLAKLVHPDVVDGKTKASAHEAFTKLNRLYGEATDRPQPFSAMKIGDWIVTAPLAKGDVADLYTASNGKGEEAVLKIARSPKDNDLMAAEAEALKRLWGPALDDNFKKYVPKLLDTFKASGRQANVLSAAPAKSYALADILEQHSDRLDFRHVVWMVNRLLAVLGYAHKQEMIHGAVWPEHLLYEIEGHGLTLVGWCYSTKLGEKMRAIPAGHRTAYPPEVTGRKAAIGATDIYMAARVAIAAADRVPKRFQAVLSEWCMAESPRARPQDAWALQETWERLAREEYGPPKYVRLELAAN